MTLSTSRHVTSLTITTLRSARHITPSDVALYRRRWFASTSSTLRHVNFFDVVDTSLRHEHLLICVNQMLILSSTRQHFSDLRSVIGLNVGTSTSFAVTSTSVFVAAMTLFDVDVNNSRSQCHRNKWDIKLIISIKP